MGSNFELAIILNSIIGCGMSVWSVLSLESEGKIKSKLQVLLLALSVIFHTITGFVGVIMSLLLWGVYGMAVKFIELPWREEK